MQCTRLTISATLAVFFGASTCLAAELYTAPREKGAPGARPAQRWADVAGSTVAAEGIVWGFYEKGFGTYVIVNGAHLYVEGLEKSKLDGRLIRVTGVLTAYRQPAAPPTSQGTNHDVVLYTIKRAKWKTIDRVEWPYLEVVDTPK